MAAAALLVLLPLLLRLLRPGPLALSPPTRSDDAELDRRWFWEEDDEVLRAGVSAALLRNTAVVAAAKSLHHTLLALPKFRW